MVFTEFGNVWCHNVVFFAPIQGRSWLAPNSVQIPERRHVCIQLRYTALTHYKRDDDTSEAAFVGVTTSQCLRLPHSTVQPAVITAILEIQQISSAVSKGEIGRGHPWVHGFFSGGH